MTSCASECIVAMHICIRFSFVDQKGLKHVVGCYILMTTLAVPTDVFVVYTCLLLDHSGMLLLRNEVRSFPSSGEDSGLLGLYNL
jgi:hypothetical protein